MEGHSQVIKCGNYNHTLMLTDHNFTDLSHLKPEYKCLGWKKLWDHALDHGPSVIKGVKKPGMVRVITYANQATSKCPLCESDATEHELGQASLAEHFIPEHTKSKSSWNTPMDSLTTMDPTFYNHIFACHACKYFLNLTLSTVSLLVLFFACMQLCQCPGGPL